MSAPLIDITGQRFGLLVALSRDGAGQPTRWRFRCDCGNTISARGSAVTHGTKRHCGCRLSEVRSSQAKRHGAAVGGRPTPEYRAWVNMKYRCDNPRGPSYANYGARGIDVCARWRASFEAFHEDMGPRPPGTSLDRINTNGNYEPGNCRWATPRQQSSNTRANVVVVHDGQSMVLMDFAKLVGVSYSNLHGRMARTGESANEAAARIAASAHRNRKAER